MNFDHGQLRALAAVLREGGFERAAAALHVTPSAVSQRIKALEDRIGRLLLRRTTPVAATPEGNVLLHLAEQTALLERDALERLGVDDLDAGPISIPVAVNHDSLATWFLGAATRFAERIGPHVQATLAIQPEDQDHTAALLREGRVLGAVTALVEPVQGCRLHRLGSVRYIATCSPDFHRRHFARGVTPAALAHAPVLTYNRKDALPARFARAIVGDAPWQPPVWRMPSVPMMEAATRAGLGWAMNIPEQIAADLHTGRIVPLRARAWIDVPMTWQHWQVRSQLMDTLTDCVLAASATLAKQG